MAFFPDKPGIVKRVDTLETQVDRLEAVRDHMLTQVGKTQYIHAPRHAAGGEDPLSPRDINAADRAHSHAYTDITNVQAMLNAFPGFDLNALAAALAPLIKPHVGGTARHVYTLYYTGQQSMAHFGCVKLTGMTPGKQLIITPHPNDEEGRFGYSVRATTNAWSLCNGLWYGKLNMEPEIYYPGQYKRRSAAEVIATYDNCYNGGLQSPDHHSIGASENISWSSVQLANYTPYLIRSDTVRLYVPFSGDIDYPYLMFWEY